MARAPTILYSTWFAFKHSTNSLKSLVSGIGTRPFLDCEEYVHSLLRGHLASGKSIRIIGLYKAAEYANGLFHTLYFTARLPVDITAVTVQLPFLRLFKLSKILRVRLDCFLSRPVSAPAFSAGVIFYVNGLQGSASGAVSFGTSRASDFQGGLGDSRYRRTSTT